MLVNYVQGTPTLWHSDCEEGEHSPPMMYVSAREDETLVECTRCGKRGYYPHGSKGRIEIEEE